MDRHRVVLYVLCGLAGILAMVFIIMCFQYGRLFRTVKHEELNGLVSDAGTAGEYEVQSIESLLASFTVAV